MDIAPPHRKLTQFLFVVGIHELQESLDFVTNKETLSSRLGI